MPWKRRDGGGGVVFHLPGRDVMTSPGVASRLTRGAQGDHTSGLTAVNNNIISVNVNSSKVVLDLEPAQLKLSSE